MELVDLSIPLMPHKLCVEKSVNPLFEAWQIRGGYKTYIISRRLRRIRYKNIFLNCYVGGNPLVISCDGLWKESEGSIFFPINLLDRIQTTIRLKRSTKSTTMKGLILSILKKLNVMIF